MATHAEVAILAASIARGQRFLIGTILDGPNAAPPPTIVLNWW